MKHENADVQQNNNNKQAQTLNMPWEDIYGYAQAVKKGNAVWISGQLGHNEKGELAVGMQEQMKQSYKNAGQLLAACGMNPDDVVEEVLYVMDMKTAFEARALLGRQFYKNCNAVASTIVVVSGLALPDQLIEVKMVAVK